MAVLFKEAYDAGFNAAMQKPRIKFDDAWAAWSAANLPLPIDLADEFKRGWSSAISYQMDAY